MWRTSSRPLTGNERHSAYGVGFREEPFWSEVDTILESRHGIVWCHRNNSSIWKLTLENQNILDFQHRSEDPLLHQTFGVLSGGDGFSVIDNRTIRQKRPTKNFILDIVAEKKKTSSERDWLVSIENTMKGIRLSSIPALAALHRAWWKNFWDRHYIFLYSVLFSFIQFYKST